MTTRPETPSAPHYFQAAVRASMEAYARKDYPTAFEQCKIAASLNPRSAELASTCGAIMHEMGRYEDALLWHKKAIALKIQKPEIYSNMANTLRALGDLDGAIMFNYRALKKDPRNSMTRNNLGCVWTELGDIEKAIHAFDVAISDDPNNYMAYFNRGNAKLLSGDYSSEAWEDYDYRSLAMGDTQKLPLPWWTGEDLNGKGVYIEVEQGQGDTFQFCRMIYPLKEKYPHARLTFQVPDELFEIIRHNFSDEICKVVPGNYRMHIPSYDYRLQLMHLCRAFPDYTDATPYLVAPHTETWYEKNTSYGKFAERKLRVGLCWKGNPRHKNDHNRSIHSHSLLVPLLDMQANLPLQIFSLQKDEVVYSGTFDPETSLPYRSAPLPLNSWEATFNFIAVLDLVITVDTSIAHVAGALGKPVWLLIPKAPDWRWGLTGTSSRWYPSMKIFRQALRGDWKHVIENVCSELSECVKTGAPLV